MLAKTREGTYELKDNAGVEYGQELKDRTQAEVHGFWDAGGYRTDAVSAGINEMRTHLWEGEPSLM